MKADALFKFVVLAKLSLKLLQITSNIFFYATVFKRVFYRVHVFLVDCVPVQFGGDAGSSGPHWQCDEKVSHGAQ